MKSWYKAEGTRHKTEALWATTILSSIFSLVILSSCSIYGDKATKGEIEVYYKEGISKDLAQQTADFIFAIDSSAHNQVTKKSFQLFRNKDTICVKMAVNQKKLDSVNDDNFYAMADLLSHSLFNDRRVNLELTDRFFKTFRTFPSKYVKDEEVKDVK